MKQIEQLQQKVDQLQSEIDQLKDGEQEYEEGQWVVAVDKHGMKVNVLRIVDNNYSSIFPYYTESVDGHPSDCFKAKNLRPATTKEIEQALIAEARRRGFKSGVEYKSIEVDRVFCGYGSNPFDPCNVNAIEEKYCSQCTKNCGCFFLYDPRTDTLIEDGCGGPHAIYHDGDWAEIIFEEPIMKQAIKKIAEQPSKIQSLIFAIRIGYLRGKSNVAIPELSDIQKNWLEENGFEYIYNEKIHEYEIKLD